MILLFASILRLIQLPLYALPDATMPSTLIYDAAAILRHSATQPLHDAIAGASADDAGAY